METMSISKHEYEEFQKYKEIIKNVEIAIHQNEAFEDILKHSEKVAFELWDNEYDNIWDKV